MTAGSVSGLLQAPKNAHICYVLVHGAGADMSPPFMAAIANGLVERGIATLRYQFPYMEQGAKRPDVPKLVRATVRAAVAEAASKETILLSREGRIRNTCRFLRDQLSRD